MGDLIETELDKLRKALAGLEAQRAVLGEAIVVPAIDSLREKIAAWEAQSASFPAPPEQPRSEEHRSEGRRIATVLFTDIVGSTALAEKLDPEDWREVLAAVHGMAGPLVQKHGGNVLQYLGDGLLALFGAQVSSENDPENAIRAALDILASLPSLQTGHPVQMRAAIHCGMVVVGELGSEAKKELTATGDAMNLAARLQSAAPPGGIIISHDAYRYVRGIFEVTPLPPLSVKGKSEPIQTYLVRRALPHPFRAVTRGIAGVETRTVGRESELSRLRAAYQEAVEGRKLVWAQLVGEPGMGKTRLLSDMQEFLAVQPVEFLTLRGRAFQGDEKQAYSLTRRMWFDRFQIPEDAPLVEAQVMWQEHFLELSGPGFEEAAHALGLLVGLPFTESSHIGGALRRDPAQVKGRAFVVSRELLESLRTRTHLVLLFEDLHWADSSSWEYLAQSLLGKQFGPHGIFILATARPEWNPPDALLKHPAYIQVGLDSLSSAACHELTLELLQNVEGVPESVVRSIVERSEGVPYFAEEMVNWFLDRGIIDQTQEPWRFVLEHLDEKLFPATLQHLLLTRLSSLRDVERSALQCGSVFGRNFWKGGLEALGVISPNQVLSQLRPRNFIHLQSESSLADETEWSFHHNLMRDVTYESVLKRDRKRFHAEAGSWLEAQARKAERLEEFSGWLGEHAERAGKTGDAAGWYLQAGEYAKARGASLEARKYFDRAIELTPVDDRERRWRILLNRDEVLGLLGVTEARLADDAALLALAHEMGDQDRLAEAYYRQGSHFHNIGDDLRALQAFDNALQAAERANNRKIEALTLGIKVVSLTHLGELHSAAAAAEKALAMAQALGEDNTLARVFNNISIYYMAVGDIARAAQILSQQVKVNRRLGDLAGEEIGLSNLGYSYVLLGLYNMGSAALEQAQKLAESIGARRSNAYNRLNLGLAYLGNGDSRAARLAVEQAIPELGEVEDLFGRAAGLSYLALVLEHSGEVAEARRYFAEARDAFSAIGMRGYPTDALAGLARCSLAQGDREAARQHIVEVWDYLEQQGPQGLEFPIRAYQTCAEVFDALGEPVKSRRAIERGYVELIQRAERISDLEWSKSFLINVPEHRAMIELWRRIAGHPATNSNQQEENEYGDKKDN